MIILKQDEVAYRDLQYYPALNKVYIPQFESALDVPSAVSSLNMKCLSVNVCIYKR